MNFIKQMTHNILSCKTTRDKRKSKCSAKYAKMLARPRLNTPVTMSRTKQVRPLALHCLTKRVNIAKNQDTQ